MRKRLVVALAILVVLAMAAPASAITYPTPDDGEHPQVGQFLFYVPDAVDSRFDDPGGWFTCSGTLIDSDVVLTAGHCTFAVGLDGASTLSVPSPLVDTNGDGKADNGTGGNDIWFTTLEESDFSILPPSSSFERDENPLRYQAWKNALNGSSDWVRGTSNPHPDYNDALFLLADVGVVELAAGSSATPSEIADEGHLDQYKNTRRNTQRFTAVGYGLNEGFPTFAGGDTRATANMMLVSLQGTYGVPRGTSVVFSNNNGVTHRGGTCFGDSGGPVFDDGTVVAVTSFGVSQTCTSPGGYYRIDQAVALDFIESFLN